ncbi:MAG: hypothetical protein KDI83_05470 [Gammaproteobacteria bacterium]|nr:hypothetical protein [Gammaproteobacteria bacterium]MCP5416726.1 hypothetical protein [Chromatiaceae bacterium]
MNRKSDDEFDGELEEWEPFLHHRNRAHRKSDGERRHSDYDEAGYSQEKKRRRVRRSPETHN